MSDTQPADAPAPAPDDRPYGARAIAEGELERWPNEHPDRDYEVSITAPEFTCLCPRSGYPDFATVEVRYVPDRWVVELKSLKLYINAFRDVAVAHEAAANRILDDLVALLDPRWIEVRADFYPRGNVHTVVTARHRQPGWSPGPDGVGRDVASLAEGYEAHGKRDLKIAETFAHSDDEETPLQAPLYKGVTDAGP